MQIFVEIWSTGNEEQRKRCNDVVRVMTNTLQLIRKLALNDERITNLAKKKAFSSKSNEV